MAKSDTLRREQLARWIRVTLREAAWAPLGVIAIYSLGLALQLYYIYPALDIPTHFLGGAAVTYFFRSAIRNSQAILGEIPFPVQVLFAFTATSTVIILWEFFENGLDYLFEAENVLGLEDTLKDMAFGLLGALVVTLFYRRR
jgi:hypothetical protein